MSVRPPTGAAGPAQPDPGQPAPTRLDDTFELAPVGLAIVAPDGRWLRVNARLSALLGYPEERLKDTTLWALTHRDDVAEMRALMASLAAGAVDRCVLDLRVRTVEGSWRWLTLSLTAVPPTPAAPEYLLAAVEDVGERRELEQRFAVQYAVSRALGRHDTAGEAITHVLQELGRHLGWRFATYWEATPNGVLHPLVLWHAGGEPLEGFAAATREMRFERGTGLPGLVWAANAPRWISDVTAESRFPRRIAAGEAGLHGAFAFPVRAGAELTDAPNGSDDGIFGIIEVLGDEVLPPNPSLLATVEGIGYQIGQFLARTRLAEVERAATARNAAVLQTALDCIVTIDHEGRFLEFNPAAERTFGYTRSDVLGRSMSELIVPPRLREAHRLGMARYLATGTARVLGQRLELPAMRADGTEFPVELTITRVPLPGPAVFTAYLRDLTETRQQAAREKLLLDSSTLLGSSLEYERTLRTLTDVVIPALADWYAVDLLEPHGGLRRLVTAHRDPSLTALAEDLGRRYPPDLAASAGVPVVIRTGRSERMEEIPEELLTSVARDAEHLALIQSLGLRSYMIVPMTTRAGVVGAMTFVTAESGRRYSAADLATAEDLARRASQAIENARLFEELDATREQLMDQAGELEMQAEGLEAMNEELRVTNEELARQTEVAARANLAKSDFLATMSHELRTPLNAILGYSQLLLDGIRGPLSDAQVADVGRIRRSGRHLLSLITDILNFAKMEAGQLNYRCTDVPLADVLAEAGELVAPQLQERGLRFTLETGEPSITVYADREKVVQILLNLLSNAVKFTLAGGEVMIRSRPEGDRIAILVEDTGRGIPPDRVEAIFEPFVQVEPARGERSSGTGLGLAISRELARAMHGELTVAATSPRGSTFQLTLLRHRPG